MPANITLEEIEDKIIDHYATEFETDPNTISAATDLKTRFNFTSPNWAAEAEPLSKLDWMRRLKVRLAQSDMNANTTVDQLTRLIKEKADQAAAGVKPKALAATHALRASIAIAAASKPGKTAKKPAKRSAAKKGKRS